MSMPWGACVADHAAASGICPCLCARHSAAPSTASCQTRQCMLERRILRMCTCAWQARSLHAVHPLNVTTPCPVRQFKMRSAGVAQHRQNTVHLQQACIIRSNPVTIQQAADRLFFCYIMELSYPMLSLARFMCDRSRS